MDHPRKRFSAIEKFLLLVAAVVVLAAVDYSLFTSQTRKINDLSDLQRDLFSARTYVVELDYLLEGYASGSPGIRPDKVTLAVKRLDRVMVRLTGAGEYLGVADEKSVTAEGMDKVEEDWERIKREAAILTGSTPAKEKALTANAVDTRLLVIAERLDTVESAVAEDRALAVKGFHYIALGTLGFVFLMVVAFGLFFNFMVIAPLKRAWAVTDRLLSGEGSARFAQSRGVVGEFSSRLNALAEAVTESRSFDAKRSLDLSERLAVKDGQIKSLGEFLSSAARSLSLDEILESAIARSVAAGGVDAAALYVDGEGSFRLKASRGFDDILTRSFTAIRKEFLQGAPRVTSDLEKFPCGELGVELASRGFNSLMCLPVTYGEKTTGILFAASTEEDAFGELNVPYFEALAAGAGVISGYAELFQHERSSRRFFESVANQMPFGIAVFGRDGTCEMANSRLRAYLGAPPGFDPVGEYRVFEDTVLGSSGVATSIKKSYEGFSTEFIINYDPALLDGFDFNGPRRRLRIRSLPFFDAGGEISRIMLLYEDVTEAGEGEGEGEKAL